MEKEVYFKIEGKVVLALLQYLSTKPFGEVNNIIPILQRLPKIDEAELLRPEVVVKKDNKRGNNQQQD